MALEAVEMQLRAAQETNPWPGGAAQLQQMGSVTGLGEPLAKQRHGKVMPCSDGMVWDEGAAEQHHGQWSVKVPSAGQQLLPVQAAGTQENSRGLGGCDEIGLETWLQPLDPVGSSSCGGRLVWGTWLSSILGAQVPQPHSAPCSGIGLEEQELLGTSGKCSFLPALLFSRVE